MEQKIVYFKNPGKENTEEVFRIAKKRAEELGIKKILVASTTGETAVKAVTDLSGFTVIAVSHSTGFRKVDVQAFTEENQEIFKSKGGTLLITTHAFAGLSRVMREKFHTYIIGDIIASTLRFFGEGMKVVCEIALMACDCGLVRTDEEVISIAGTHSGADTAVVVKPATTGNTFDLKVKEILCKPRF